MSDGIDRMEAALRAASRPARPQVKRRTADVAAPRPPPPEPPPAAAPPVYPVVPAARPVRPAARRPPTRPADAPSVEEPTRKVPVPSAPATRARPAENLFARLLLGLNPAIVPRLLELGGHSLSDIARYSEAELRMPAGPLTAAQATSVAVMMAELGRPLRGWRRTGPTRRRRRT